MSLSAIRVLFVSSGKQGRPGNVVYNQGESLRKQGVELDYLLVRPGILGYLSAVPAIRQAWRTGRYDLVHAHYSLSALTASVAGRFPVVASLMGSDVFMSPLLRSATRIIARRRWIRTIVKTQQMKERMGIAGAEVIPNGVDLDLFRPVEKKVARDAIGYRGEGKLIIFLSEPGRPEKNFWLAESAVKLLGEKRAELRRIHGIKPEEVCMWMNAADLLLLTSKWEGSPNVIKEAMACNCPIVYTDAGDARQVIGKTAGCFLTTYRPEDAAAAIREALAFNARTDGRKRIMELKLDSVSVARSIISLYEGVNGR